MTDKERKKDLKFKLGRTRDWERKETEEWTEEINKNQNVFLLVFMHYGKNEKFCIRSLIVRTCCDENWKKISFLNCECVCVCMCMYACVYVRMCVSDFGLFVFFLKALCVI